jgi:hypothetical protein
MSGSGRDRDRSDSNRTGSRNKPGEAQLNKIIDTIETDIKRFAKELEKGQKSEKDKDDMKARLFKQLERLGNLGKDYPVAAGAMDLDNKIQDLKDSIEFPNRRQPSLPPLQLQARAAAAEVVANWERVTPGVSLNDLPPDARVLLQACTMEEWSPLQLALNAMIEKRERKRENVDVIRARLNFAIALFQAMVPQFCGNNIPTETHFEQNENVRSLLDCIAIVACNKSEEGYNPLFVFAEAAFQNPLQFLKDAAGFSFAFGALTEMAGPTVVELVQQVPPALFRVGKYMVTNPLASFTTYQVAEPYIKGLLQQVFGERFGGRYQEDQRIVDLFNQLSEFYLSQGVIDIIGFPPADIDSIRNKLSQMLYNIGYRGVASMQGTGDILLQALRFPGELCKSMMGAGSAIKTWVCSQGMRLLDRYKFIPQGTDEGLFESILACLDHKGLLDNPHIDAFVIAYLKHNQPTTVIGQSVRQHIARGVLQHGPLLAPGQGSESLNVDIDSDSSQEEMEVVGLSSGNVSEPGVISADQNMPSSDGDKLGQLRTDQQTGILHSHEVQIAARTAEEEEAARRLAASAQGGLGAQRPSARGGFDGPAQGGHSRSRKHSVSKRTRRKGVGKKQKSKKNKRQSRRKVRRASSRKLRK